MSNIVKFFSVPNLSDIPNPPVDGTIYFVENENYILVHLGGVTTKYGNIPGPQGIPGEPIPELQAQILDLADANINHSLNLYLVEQRLDRAFLKLKESVDKLPTELVELHNEAFNRFMLDSQSRMDSFEQSTKDLIAQSKLNIQDLQDEVKSVLSEVQAAIDAIDDPINFNNADIANTKQLLHMADSRLSEDVNLLADSLQQQAINLHTQSLKLANISAQNNQRDTFIAESINSLASAVLDLLVAVHSKEV